MRETTIAKHRRDLPEQIVRIVGDPFKNPYTLIAEITTTARSDHRLYGGSVEYLLRTWSGRERTATCVVDFFEPWSEMDHQFAGIGPRHRAAIARQQKVAKLAAQGLVESHRRTLASSVKFIRSLPRQDQRDHRCRLVARNTNLPLAWVVALVESGAAQ